MATTTTTLNTTANPMIGSTFNVLVFVSVKGVEVEEWEKRGVDKEGKENILFASGGIVEIELKCDFGMQSAIVVIQKISKVWTEKTTLAEMQNWAFYAFVLIWHFTC